MSDKHASWFWYGRYEAAVFGNYTPPAGLLAPVLYWCGHLVGRHFGPPAERS
jgi:hypothetical protein